MSLFSQTSHIRGVQVLYSFVHSFARSFIHSYLGAKRCRQSMPQPIYSRGRHTVPIQPERGWAPEPVWTVLANRRSLVPTGTGSTDRPACSLSLHRLRYPGYLEINADYKKRLGNTFWLFVCHHKVVLRRLQRMAKTKTTKTRTHIQRTVLGREILWICLFRAFLSIYIYIYTCIYMYRHTHIYIYIYIYIIYLFIY